MGLASMDLDSCVVHSTMDMMNTTVSSEPADPDPDGDMAFFVEDLGAYPDLTQLPSVQRLLIAAYVLIILLTITGNGLVICVVMGQRRMRTSVNYLICNLAVSDILVGAFVSPVKLLEMVVPTQFRLHSSALCTALSFTQSVAIFSTILTLLVISLERFLVIVYPLHSRRFSTRRRTNVYIVLSWLVAALISIPNLFGSTTRTITCHSDYGNMTVSLCLDSFGPHFRKGYFLFLFIVVYCLPMLIILTTSGLIIRTLFRTKHLLPLPSKASAAHLAGCSGGCRASFKSSAGQTPSCTCSRSSTQPLDALGANNQRHMENRRKVAAMMVVVSIAFAICWSPYFFVTITVEYIYDFFQYSNFFFTLRLITLLGFLNSCINPLIYIMNERFREQYVRLLEEWCCALCIRLGRWRPRLRPRQASWQWTQASQLRRATQRTICSRNDSIAGLVPGASFRLNRRRLQSLPVACYGTNAPEAADGCTRTNTLNGSPPAGARSLLHRVLAAQRGSLLAEGDSEAGSAQPNGNARAPTHPLCLSNGSASTNHTAPDFDSHRQRPARRSAETSFIAE